MFCHNCGSEMIQAEQHEVTIETCATCGGVWLKKGVLGELMARAKQAGSFLDEGLTRAKQPPIDYGRSFYRDRKRHGDDQDDDRHDYKRTRRSIWDIFD